jgi:23S rRNA pseudouridine1911/1915/1917 synthase
MKTSMATHSVTVRESEQGQRLDRFLATALPELSRSRLRDLIRRGQVHGSAGTIMEPDYRVKPADCFEIALPAPEPAGPEAEAIPLKVLYEDDALIVIDKPAGLVVHPAAGHWTGTLVNALIAHCGESLSGIGGVRRPGIVHRLDKDTSGVMVVAKTDAAHHGLAKQFADHGRAGGGLERRYCALVWGAPRLAKGVIEANIGRHPASRVKMAVLTQAGKPALTTYRTLEVYGGKPDEPAASLLECRLETGRTHQIRVHLAHIGHPVIGDAVYGMGYRSKTRALPDAVRFAILNMHRQALHAAFLGFHHPITRRPMQFESELPEDMRRAKNALAAG